LTQPEECETFSIASLHRHPDYFEAAWDAKGNDYNLMKISGFSTIKPVKLNRDPKVPSSGATVTTIGFGSTSPDPATFVESASNILQEVDLEIVSHSACKRSHDRKRNISYAGLFMKESMICTSGGPHNEKDACAFDSGSPILLTPENSDQEEDLVVALVSWGIDCADPFFPAVNARVSFAVDWIDETVCKVSSAHPSQLSDFGCERFHPSRFDWRRFIHHSTCELWQDGQSYSGNFGKLYLSFALCLCLLIGLVGSLFQKMRSSRRRVSLSCDESERRPIKGDGRMTQTYNAI
jgi:hypothetical protein